MNGRKTSIAFLISIILYFACNLGIVLLLLFVPNFEFGLLWSNLIVELVILLPGILFALFSGEKLPRFLGFHRIKITTLLLIIPFTMLSTPLLTLLNLITQFWVNNTVTDMMQYYGAAQMPFWKLWVSIGLLAPICEEVACRGLFYRGYEKSRGVFRAMLLSALLFALIHMNLNQAVYAFAMGIMSVLLVEATGSLWASVFYHALINSSQVAIMYAALLVNSVVYSNAEETLGRDMLMYVVVGYLIITAITLPLAFGLLTLMSSIQGRKGALLALWRDRKVKYKKDNPAIVILLIAVILCVAFIIWSMVA